MLTRTQISLPSDQHRRARVRAADQGISLAEYIRRLLERDLDPEQPPRGLTSIFDLGSSGGSDVARHKQSYVTEAVDRLGR